MGSFIRYEQKTSALRPGMQSLDGEAVLVLAMIKLFVIFAILQTDKSR